MKISFSNRFFDTDVSIRKDYRRDILKFIKKVIYSSDNHLYTRYYDAQKRTQKPFTFSVTFRVKEDKTEYFILDGNLCKIHISSIDPVFVMTIYNGMLKFKNNSQIFGETKQKIEHIFLEKEREFDDDTVVFKTLSPILVRSYSGTKSNGFLSYDSPDFVSNLSLSTVGLVKRLAGINIDTSEIIIEPVKMSCSVAKNYGGEIGNKGLIKINAPNDVLKIIYQAGIGAKRSQGYGMLEVVG